MSFSVGFYNSFTELFSSDLINDAASVCEEDEEEALLPTSEDSVNIEVMGADSNLSVDDAYGISNPSKTSDLMTLTALNNGFPNKKSLNNCRETLLNDQNNGILEQPITLDFTNYSYNQETDIIKITNLVENRKSTVLNDNISDKKSLNNYQEALLLSDQNNGIVKQPIILNFTNYSCNQESNISKIANSVENVQSLVQNNNIPNKESLNNSQKASLLDDQNNAILEKPIILDFTNSLNNPETKISNTMKSVENINDTMLNGRFPNKQSLNNNQKALLLNDQNNGVLEKPITVDFTNYSYDPKTSNTSISVKNIKNCQESELFNDDINEIIKDAFTQNFSNNSYNPVAQISNVSNTIKNINNIGLKDSFQNKKTLNNCLESSLLNDDEINEIINEALTRNISNNSYNPVAQISNTSNSLKNISDTLLNDSLPNNISSNNCQEISSLYKEINEFLEEAIIFDIFDNSCNPESKNSNSLNDVENKNDTDSNDNSSNNLSSNNCQEGSTLYDELNELLKENIIQDISNNLYNPESQISNASNFVEDINSILDEFNHYTLQNNIQKNNFINVQNNWIDIFNSDIMCEEFALKLLADNQFSKIRKKPEPPKKPIEPLEKVPIPPLKPIEPPKKVPATSLKPIELLVDSGLKKNRIRDIIIGRICEKCNIEFSSNRELRCHIERHHPKNFTCLTCGKVFQNEKRAERHIHEIHGERIFACAECPKTFKRKGELTRHMKAKHWLLGHKCDLCEKAFTRREYLTDHKERMHSGKERTWRGRPLKVKENLEEPLEPKRKETRGRKRKGVKEESKKPVVARPKKTRGRKKKVW